MMLPGHPPPHTPTSNPPNSNGHHLTPHHPLSHLSLPIPPPPPSLFPSTTTALFNGHHTVEGPPTSGMDPTQAITAGITHPSPLLLPSAYASLLYSRLYAAAGAMAVGANEASAFHPPVLGGIGGQLAVGGVHPEDLLGCGLGVLGDPRWVD